MVTSPSAAQAWSDELVPSQWLDRVASSSVTDSPERRLLLAILVDAIRCLQSASEKERASTASWVRGENGAARILFRSLCDSLDLEPVLLARRLLTWAGSGPPIGRSQGYSNKMRVVTSADAIVPNADAKPFAMANL